MSKRREFDHAPEHAQASRSCATEAWRFVDAGQAGMTSTACGEDCFYQITRDVRRNGFVPAVERGFTERNGNLVSLEVLHAVRADLEVMFELRANISRELIRQIVREFATAHCEATSQYIFMAPFGFCNRSNSS